MIFFMYLKPTFYTRKTQNKGLIKKNIKSLSNKL